jgi:DNA invertase Pin-like site-specific DNA recombinase
MAQSGHRKLSVRACADAGRSGLSIDGRAGLLPLLAGVQGGVADISVIVVYDISRWRRFPDSDEKASYEYSQRGRQCDLVRTGLKSLLAAQP